MSGLTYANQVGAGGGLNQAAPGTFIGEEFVRWAQDIFFDRTGLLRRRPPFQTINLNTQPNTAGERVLGFISTLNMVNRPVFCLIIRNSTGIVKFYYYDENFVLRSTSTSVLESLDENAIVYSRPALNNGAFVGFFEDYGLINTGVNDHYLYYWRGGTGLDLWTETSCTLGTTAVFRSGTSGATSTTFTNQITKGSGSFDTTNIVKGMFAILVDDTSEFYLGVVRGVTTTAVSLEKDIIRPSLAMPTLTNKTIKFVNMRPFIHSHGRGLITYDGIGTTVTSGPIGGDGEGHFAAADINAQWALYRASDGAWIGNVASAPDNETIILDSTNKTNISMAGDEYVARRYTQGVISNPVFSEPLGRASVPLVEDAGVQGTAVYTTDSSQTATIKTRYPGIFNTTYAGYQFFGNGGLIDTQSNITFSSSHDAEAVDLSLDAADSLTLPATQQMRGMASSQTGLVIFFENKTFILRGNSRLNFSVEELHPEGCLAAQSIVEFGGGVFWASKRGIMFYDGNSVRNLVEGSLGVYYTDSIKTFNASTDAIYSFVYKDYLFMNFTRFNSTYRPVRYEPIYAESIDGTEAIADFEIDDWDPDFKIDDFEPINNVPIYWDYKEMYGTDAQPGMTFAVYLPTGAVTTVSNFDFRGFASVDITASGVTGYAAINAVNPVSSAGVTLNGVAPRLIDVNTLVSIENNHSVVEDSELCEQPGLTAGTYFKGPDFYMQTKHYTFGDPTLRKWFRQLFLNLYLIDGALRLDVVDNEDKDTIDIEKKRRRNWEVFEEDVYNWGELSDIILPKILSPNRSTWGNVVALNISWYEFSNAQFQRRKKKFSWRYPSMGFRLYQMNNYRPRNLQTSQKPHTVMLDSWSIGFKPMRQSRV